jgi:predicted N-formylglutamate amidohydrolase
MNIVPFPPVEFIAGDPGATLLLVCDHASNRLPAEYGDLGLPAAAFARHIAYDIGAAAVTRGLAARLRAPAILSTWSRLLIDPNRGEDDPTLVMRLSDGAIVPGNHRVDGGEIERRLAGFHRPYHAAIGGQLAAMAARGPAPAVFSIHSFTNCWKGVERPWHVAVLWDRDPRFVEPLLGELRAQGDLVVGDNEPYDGALANDTMHRHCTRAGLAHALIEIRQDLIGGEAGVARWVDRLAPMLARIDALAQLHEVRHFGSRSDD